jgi:hypothetical protein
MTGFVLYPALSVQVPALCDYLNHLARMHILANIGDSEALRSLYRVHWQMIPYLAMDASFAVLDHFAPIYEAGRVFVAMCVILPVVSVAALHYAVHRRVSLVPVTAFLFCYNYMLSWGFLNYLPALCLAVLLFAGWLGSTEWSRWPRAAMFCVLATMLYLGHLVAFGAYCLSVSAYELARVWRTGFRPPRKIAADWLAAGFQALPAVVLLLCVNIERPFVGPALTSYGDLSSKLIALLSPVLFSGHRADILAGGFACSVLAGGLATCRLRLAPAVWPSALAVGVVAICVPQWLLGTFGMDVRLPLLVVILLVGGISTTERMERNLGYVLFSGFMVLTAVRSADSAKALRKLDGQTSEVRDVVAAMPRGMRLLLVNTAKGPYDLMPWSTLHIGMVAVIDRDAFVPNLFTGLSIVRPAPELKASSTPAGPPLNMSDLAEGFGRKDDPTGDNANGSGGRIYWLGWETKFDYVLIEHFGNRPEAPPGVLRLVATSSVADLYRIDKTVSP